MDPIHILLIEDNEGDIILTTEALTMGKIIKTITAIKDGKEAIDFLEKKHPYHNRQIPDLILLDINLPKMNGHEVLKTIRANNDIKHIPVIMFTTSSSENDILQAYQNFANCYLTKPSDADDFLKIVLSIENFWINYAQLSVKTQ